MEYSVEAHRVKTDVTVKRLFTSCDVCARPVQTQHSSMQQELEAVRSRAAALAGISEECGELKARLASARAAAAAAKQAAQQQEFQLQAQVSYGDPKPNKQKDSKCPPTISASDSDLDLGSGHMQIISASYGLGFALQVWDGVGVCGQDTYNQRSTIP